MPQRRVWTDSVELEGAMKQKPEREPEKESGKGASGRHRQFPQESWTEIDAEGTDSEMAEGRQASEPFYTPLVTEAAERRLRKERQQARGNREQEEERKAQGTGHRARGQEAGTSPQATGESERGPEEAAA